MRAAAERFLISLVERYRNHPALFGYDLWNENTFNGGSPAKMYCYCDATKRKLRDWLRARYKTPQRVGQVWNRYSYESWDDVEPPPNFGGYPESLDWLQFRIDNAFDLFHWRVGLFRKLDPKHLIAAHGVAGTLESLPSSAHDEWRSSAEVDTWGFTFVASRKGDEPWKQFQAVDLVRGGSRGKPFWHAEAQAGPLWMQPQVIKQAARGRAYCRRERCPAVEPGLVRGRSYGHSVSALAAAARRAAVRGVRPLWHGRLRNAARRDGRQVRPLGERSPGTMEIAARAGRHRHWCSRPNRRCSTMCSRARHDFYAESIRGAYQAFFDSNIQPDFVAVDDLQKYKVAYLPYPVMLNSATVKKLRAYVEQGGTLISEGLPAYFGDHGRAGPSQPNYELDSLFGARESYVEFTPDLLEKLTFELRGQQIDGRYFLQEYELTTGLAAGHYMNGHIAAVENNHGRGRTLLIGTFPGGGYFGHHTPAARAFFAGLLKFGGGEPRLRTSNPAVQARLHTGAGGNFLWVINPTRSAAEATVWVNGDLGFRTAEDVWSNRRVSAADRSITVTVAARDAAVVALR